jgi:hypothetical protein
MTQGVPTSGINAGVNWPLANVGTVAPGVMITSPVSASGVKLVRIPVSPGTISHRSCRAPRPHR